MVKVTWRNILRGGLLVVLAAFVFLTRETWIRTGVVLALAAAFTLLLAPLSARLEGKGMKSSRAAIASIAIWLLILVVILLLFVPYLVTHTAELIRRMTPTLSGIVSNLHALMGQWGVQIEEDVSLPKLIASALSPLTAGIARGSITVFTWVGHLVFSLVISYYLLAERRTVANHLILFIPLRWRTAFLSAMLGCRNAVLSYASGVIKTSLFVSAATFAGLALLGVRDALILSLFMGLFEILPYIGPVLGAIPILLSAIPLGLTHTLLALVLVLAVQQIESSVIGPYFTASSTSIHPLAAILSVFVFGSLFGVWGVLLAVPILVTARSVFWSLRGAAIRIVS